MKMGIGIGWPNASAGISYVSKLIKAFKARVLSYPNSIFEAEPCLDATLVGLNAIGLLKEASLVITPNAYNEGILYDVVPNTTLGDMDVVRATTATRVNSAGLIEVVPRNLLTYSNDFTNVVWVQQAGTSVVSTNNLSPSGLLDAAKVISNGSNGIYQAPIAVSSSLNNTKSIYLKGVVGGETVLLRDPWQSINTISCTLTTEWQRFSLTEIQSGGEAGLWVKNIPSTGIYIYGAQLESFATATEYFQTTTRLNIPRIDYTNGSCPSLLVEPQRTNLLTYSEQFDDSNWVKAGGTITANVAISPDGTQNADLFNNANIYQQRTQANNTTYCFSVYVKKNTATDVTIGYIDNVTGFVGGDIRYTYSTNSLTIFQSPNGSVSGQAVDVGNGWIRIILKYTTIAIVTFNYQYIASNGSYVYGTQLEAGAYPTSYIPTVASTVTRNADVISKTGISSLIGQTEGVLFLDLKDAYNGYIGLSDNSDANSVLLAFSKQYSALNFYIYANSADIIGTGFVALPSSPMKLAFKYKSGEIKLFVNGVLAYSNTSAFTFSSNLSFFGNGLYWGGGTFEGLINSEQLYKTALTDTECINLTTL